MAAIDTTRTLSNSRRNDISDIYVATPTLDEAGRKAAFEAKFGESFADDAGQALLRKYANHWYELDSRYTVRQDVILARRRRWAQAIRPGDERWVVMDAIYPGHGVSKQEAKKISGRYKQLWDKEEHTDQECASLALGEMTELDHLKRGSLYRQIMNALEEYFLEK
ncbi:hypothetical protein HYFRA_00009493 [Hymenoscyphus fraxineus]|uniref:Uncharacterized protein n=1 Tax=Hymenoscyphus fraxineus TaxID=746836 RepID=A0A9N9KXY6_9HELO|nr:hypothetical protein HYFRA_00009493 [Hymenoscyphus fraxineus]